MTPDRRAVRPWEDLDFEAARRSVARVALRTPLLDAPELTERVGRQVLLKLENLQVTGSFKVRGAAARLAALTPAEAGRGVVTCSSGNHGRALAHVAGRRGVPAAVFVPEWVDPVKLRGIRDAGAEARVEGDSFDESEARAVQFADATGRVYVSAYDDPWVIAGQGTIALEIIEDAPLTPAAVLAPLSGGGLAGGMAAALRWSVEGAAPALVAVSADRAAVMRASVRAGHPVEVPEEDTVASALAGGIGAANRWSFPLVEEFIAPEDLPGVGEDEIEEAIAFCFRALGLVVEGGGAVTVAALLSGAWRPPTAVEGPVVAVVSGGNIATGTLARVLAARAG